MRILLVDDLSDSNDSLELLFSLWPGYEVRSAMTGEEGLAIAREFNPDAVILDVGMPVMDGYELARRLRAEYGPKLKIICLTGYGQENDIRQAKDSGCDHHLIKPADPNEIRQILEMGLASTSPTRQRGIKSSLADASG